MVNTTPTVSVIVPNYNHARFLPKRIESIFGQSFQNFELILLDDCSTDDSRSILCRYASDPRVRVEFNEVNSGSSFKQWNKGVSLARGEYVWIAESDDYADRQLLETLVTTLGADPTVMLAYCRSWRVTEDDQKNGFGDWYLDYLDPQRWTANFVTDGVEECQNYFVYSNPVPNASAVVFRRAGYQRVGGADEKMPGLDGFAVLNRLRERSEAMARAHPGEKESLPQIIFATAYDQYAVRAFDVNAVDYLLKPFDRTRVEQAVERAKSRMSGGGETQIDALLRLLNHGTARAHPPAKLIVQAQSRLLLVDQAEICFAAIDDGIIRVVTQTFEGQSKCRTLEELFEQLDPAVFWRAHRGFVVNINHIREVVPWFKSTYQLRMNDKQQTEIPVSRSQTRRLRELFNL